MNISRLALEVCDDFHSEWMANECLLMALLVGFSGLPLR